MTYMYVKRTEQEVLIDQCLPIVLALVTAVRDEGPEGVQAIYDRVPADGMPTMLVLLAAMVDDQRTPEELLAWTEFNKPSAREAELRRLRRLGVSDVVSAPIVAGLPELSIRQAAQLAQRSPYAAAMYEERRLQPNREKRRKTDRAERPLRRTA